MLLLFILLSIAGANALGSISGRNPLKSPILVRGQQTDPCASQCAIPLGVLANCSTSSNPFCGCSQFVPAAGPCETCLAQTNSTVGGVLNALFVAEAVVICNCQGPSCGDLVLSSRQCQATDPTNPYCTCPAIVRDTDCYACMEANDTSIADTLRGDVSRCQTYFSQQSASATSSSSVSPTASPSVTMFTGGGNSMSSQNSLLFSLSIVAIGFVYGM